MQSAKIPKEVLQIIAVLQTAGYQAYLVGGCVRDLLLERTPKDWDIATDAAPEKVQELFPDSVYENEFGTVLVKVAGDKRQVGQSEDPMSHVPLPMSLRTVEVTTFRVEGRYTDKRHPDEVRFAKTIEEDLARRDFTINAMALDVNPKHEVRSTKQAQNSKSEISENYDLDIVSDFPPGEDRPSADDIRISDFHLIDPYSGQEDLSQKVIRTVGDPYARFGEDALRMLRAVRFAAELGWEIEFNTRRAIEKKAGLLEAIAKERIRDEFVKIILSSRAKEGVLLLEELNLLRYVLPELREGLGVGQNKHHIYSVFEHNLRALDYTVQQNYPLHVRLAALLHDVGKPRSKKGDGPDSTFYGHEYIGARMTAKALDRLAFSKDLAEFVTHLVRSHMFYYNTGEVTASGVRRFLARVGPENVDDIMKVREADRIGSGVPKAVVYKMRHLLFMIEKVRHDPLSPKMLKVNGEDVMRRAGIPPGPRVGQILGILLEEVLDEPAKNEPDYLNERVDALQALSDAELQARAVAARTTKEEAEQGIEEEMKKKFRV